MKKAVSVILAIGLLLSSAIITGCVNNGGNVIENGNQEEVTTADYSRFVGDWYNYSMAITTILAISNVEGDEMTFSLIRSGGETDELRVSADYTLPITNGQVQFEENDITSDDEWVMQNHTLTFYDDHILWLTEANFSWTAEDGTVQTSEDELERRFELGTTLPFWDYWQERLDELRS